MPGWRSTPPRGRQTERPAAPFRSVLAGSVSLLMSGAEVATHVVGGPLLAAAVHDARVGAASALAGPGAAAPAGGATARRRRRARPAIRTWRTWRR